MRPDDRGRCARARDGGGRPAREPSAVDGGQATAASPSGALSPEEASQVLAHVGDRTITLGDYAAALEHMDQFDRIRYSGARAPRRELLGEMIDVMLLADEARAKGYDKDPVTQQELREILRDALLKKAREGAPAPNDIPAAEVQAYFDAHRADFHDPERRRVSAIVLATRAAAAGVLEAAAQGDTRAVGGAVVRRSIDRDAGARQSAGSDARSTSRATSASSARPATRAEPTLRVPGGGPRRGLRDRKRRRRPAAGRASRRQVLRREAREQDRRRTTARSQDAERSIRVKLAQDKIARGRGRAHRRASQAVPGRRSTRPPWRRSRSTSRASTGAAP